MVCVQIGLVDVLREEYGITPGGVLGHSAGEIACGYGDGCFTREQTVLVAYHRGRMCPEHNISGGLMAAVGLGADEAEARLAKHGKSSCVVGCDNSPNSVTLSGNALLGAFTHIHALYGNFSPSQPEITPSLFVTFHVNFIMQSLPPGVLSPCHVRLPI